MRILWDNKMYEGILDVSSEAANFPKENLRMRNLVPKYRTLALTAQTVTIDAGVGEVITAQSAAVAGHNLTISATVEIQAIASGGSWGSPALDETITYRSGIMMKYFTGASYRHWRFKFEDLSNADGFIELGQLFFGQYLQMDPSSAVEFPMEHQRTDESFFTITGQLYVDKGVQIRGISYSFERVGNAMKVLTEVFWNNVGKHTQFFFANYDTNFTVIGPIYMALVKDITFGHLPRDKWKFGLSLQEVF